MDQSTKLNQSCSPSSMQNKLFNGVQMKVNRVLDCDYCHLPCTTQKHNKSYIASLNPTKEPCSMRNSFYVPENRQTIMGSFCRQLTSSIIPPSDPILSYCKPTDLQLTPNNDYIASMPSMFQPLPFLLQSTSSSVIPVSSSSTLSSSLSPFHSPYNLPSSVYPSVPFSNHLRPSYCSFSSHSLKPIPSVKPYLSSNRAHLESSRIMLDSVNTKSFNQTTTSNALSTTITTATMNNAAIITDKTGDCAYHQSEQLNSTLLHHASGDSLSNQDSKFSFLHPPVFHSSSLKTSAIVENISDNNNSLTNLIADLFPTSSSNIPQTCLIPSSTSLTCRNVSQLTQTSTVSSAQLPSNNLNDNLSNNYENGMLITNSNSNGSGNGSTSTSTTSCITNINDDLTIDKKLPNLNIENSSASNTSESSNADEKCTSLPRFNLRYTNVLHYPKYSSRKNSGFERRLKHTGLILDAKSTLRLLRKFLQPFVNRDFDQLIKKYMDDFILLAVNNIRDVLGEQSVSENDLTKFRQSLIHRAAVRYFPDLPQRDFINHQGTRSNPSPKTRDNKPEKQSSQRSDSIMRSKINSCSSFPSKLNSRIPTPDSLESSMSFNNSPHLSPIPSSDPTSFDKSFLSTNDITNPAVDKTFRTVYSPLHNPVTGDNESHYRLRNISNDPSLRNVRKRLQPSNRLKISPISYDKSKSDNSNHPLINTESFTTADCEINDLQEKCTSLPLSSHSPSSASSNSTVGFFRDPFSSDSEGTLIDSSNIKLSEQTNNTQINRSSTYAFHYSPNLLSTIKNNSNAPIHRLKSKSSRGRKTPWWDRTRGKKSKVTTNNNNIQCDKHNEGLSYEKNSLVEADYRQFINTLSNQSVTSSAIHASNNISKDLPHSSNQNIHNNDSNTCKNTSSRLSRKKCTQIKNTMNNFTTKNSNVMKFTFDQNTHFALGSSANTWLGMGTARGRIYSKHPELFRYICDNEDKAWLVQTGLIISPGVKAYLVHAEQVHQIATQQINSYSSKADIEKLRTFKLPYWFLQKVKTVASRHSFFVHVISTELESTKNEIEKNIQDNSSSVDRPFASPFIQSSSSSMSLSNISQFKLDDSTSLSNPMETNHYTSHNIITTIPSSRKILNSPVIFSSSSPSALSLASSSSVTSKYSLTASSSVQECHDMDNNQDSNNNNSNVLLNRNYTKSNWKSTNSYSKTMSIDYADQNNNNNLVNEIQSLPSPNPPTLERFDYTTNR
ncbi:unnamed protein product [Schistosoma rodhaini]|uniref:DNTTIP1 dimerisation domain-containing protein n=1 Tax=Schistosoma rodhaini TaxID=6188 RepID=A0AA85EW02_9TREM|nr:unnamed protein product [Schistosoma rodhaini]